MNVDVEWHEGVHFTATTGSGHVVEIDGPPDLGGLNNGVRPMELMLLSIGGCAATDVVHILRKGRQEISSCKVSVHATRAEQEPRVFTGIHLVFQVAGAKLNANKLERAIHLSAEKYCSASILMQRAGVVVTHEYEIVG